MQVPVRRVVRNEFVDLYSARKSGHISIMTTGNTHEWRWTQTYACGHETPQSCLDGQAYGRHRDSRPDAERDRLSRTECPKCGLMA